MKAELTKNESKELVLQFDDNDTTVPEMIAGRLSGEADVEFAGVVQDHPEVGKPRLVLKTEKKKAIDTLSKAIDSIEEDLTELKSQLSKKK